MAALTQCADLISREPSLPTAPSNVLALDSESRLAFGKRIDLKVADAYELELIPGIADASSRKIIKDRTAIMRAASKLPSAEKYRALEVVHGIGLKTAQKFASSLCLEPLPCV